MHIVLSFLLLLLGNYLVADWAADRYLHDISSKLIYGPWFYLYFPIGAYFLVCSYDAINAKVTRIERRNALLLYLSPPAYLLMVYLVAGEHPKGWETILMLPIIVVYPIGALILVLSIFPALYAIPMFYRAIVGASVPPHPARAIVRTGRIEPGEAAALAASIRDSMSQTLGFSALQVAIRNKRYSELLHELSRKVDLIAEKNRRAEAAQRAEAERIARPERERLEALARAANLDAELTKQIIELVRENERKRRIGG